MSPHVFDPPELDEWETEDELRAYAQEHGVPALLDHLGLDEFGNEVIATRRSLRLAEEFIHRQEMDYRYREFIEEQEEGDTHA